VAILVPLLIVLGLTFLAWGAFRLMWDTRWDKVIGAIMLAASGLLETIRCVEDRCGPSARRRACQLSRCPLTTPKGDIAFPTSSLLAKAAKP